MAQKRYLFLGLAAVLALAFTATMVVREIAVTDARTNDAQMSMTVSTGGACNGSTCTVPLSGAFTLQVKVDTALAEGYIGLQTEVDYASLVASGGNYKPATTQNFGTEELVWPDGTFPLRAPEPPMGNEGLVNHADATALINPPESTFTGPVLELDMNCGSGNSSNTINLVPINDIDNTDATGFKQSGADGGMAIAAKTSPLTLICGAAEEPTNTPEPATDTPEGPTNTPAPPTETPTEGPTSTPAPPTNTPAATNTPAPTNTPMPATATPTPGEEQNGDANCNGEVNSVDALWILWDVADISDLIPCPDLADADKDGDITSIDAALVLQFEAGKIGPLP